VRILFLSHYFPPEVNAPASRTYEHCRQWVRAGHEVTVITCAPNHPRGVVYEGYRNRLWQEERRDGIRVIRLWTFVTANEGFLKRTLGYVSFMVACMLAAPFLPKADVVLTTSPQFFNGLAGYPVSRMKRAAWVLEIRDLWPESIVVLGSLKNRVLIRRLEWLELFAYRKADAIVPNTDSFARYMVAKGISSEKIEVIKNGVDLSFFQPLRGENPLRAELGLEGKLVFAYFGTLGMAHGLDTVLVAAQLLREHPQIVFLLVGDGAERKRLIELRESRGLSNVVILDQQPKARMPTLWDLASASIVHLKKSPLFETVLPSKIFESMAMERPIVLGVEGEAAQLVTAARAGVVFEPENARQLADAVLRLASDPGAARRMGASGREYVLEHFDRTRLAAGYENLLLRTAGALPHSRGAIRRIG
jgi:glycosyltransferase involved in cell wall biosynthesis